MKVEDYARIEFAARVNRSEAVRLGVAPIFIAVVIIETDTTFAEVPQNRPLVVLALVGAEMAMSAGAGELADAAGLPAGNNDAVGFAVVPEKAALPAWIVTVPVSPVLAATFFFTLRGMLLP